MEFCYNLPANLIFGRGKADSVGEISSAYGKNALVVTGTGGTKRSGLLDRVTDSLEKAGIKCAVFDKVTQNPLITTVTERRVMI